MSTKKKLMEVVKKIADIDNQEKYAHNQIAAYEIGQDMPKHTKELTRLYGELERKRNTPITKELLEKNGFKVLTSPIKFPFKTWRLKDHPNFWFDEYEQDREYLDDGTFGLVKKGTFLIRFASTRTDFKTVADLEDALDLCGIDEEIQL